MLIDLSWILKITYVKNIAQYLEYISFFFFNMERIFPQRVTFFHVCKDSQNVPEGQEVKWMVQGQNSSIFTEEFLFLLF